MIRCGLVQTVQVLLAVAETVSGTLGDGGLLLPGKGAATVAAAVHRVLNDGELRDSLVEAGTRRLADFSLPASRGRWRDALAALG